MRKPFSSCKRWLAVLVLAGACLALDAPVFGQAHYAYCHIAAQTSATTCKTGAGVLYAVVVNKAAATSVITVYDNTSAANPVVAIVTTASTGTFTYNVQVATGVTIKMATADSDITVVTD